MRITLRLATSCGLLAPESSRPEYELTKGGCSGPRCRWGGMRLALLVMALCSASPALAQQWVYHIRICGDTVNPGTNFYAQDGFHTACPGNWRDGLFGWSGYYCYSAGAHPWCVVFDDDVPTGSKVTKIRATVYIGPDSVNAGCAYALTLNGQVISDGSSCTHRAGGELGHCGFDKYESGEYPDGVPGYVYGGQNQVGFNLSGPLCVAATIVGLYYEKADSSQGLRAGFGNGPSDPGTETIEVGGSPPLAKVPLGSTFFLQLTTTDESGVVTPMRSSFNLEPASVSPPIAGPAIFRNHVVLEYDRSRSDDIKFFQAVHMGTVFVNIVPEDTSKTPVRVQIQVNSPSRLGFSHGEVDALLMDYAHRRGIPPQMLKGQAENESGFHVDGYRYEPLSADLRYISDGQNLRTQNPYRDYRLRTSDGLEQGADISQADISPRSRYRTRRGPITDADQCPDRCVSAREIYEVNDRVQNWGRASPARREAVRQHPELLDFTAQTPIAASWGLFQIMYATAIAPMHWPGVNGHRNPSLLFDTEQNLAAGGGSVDLGTGYLRRVFSRANPQVSLADPNFSRRSAFESAFQRAFNYYNHNGVDGQYGINVMNYTRSYTPVPSTSIFQ